MRRMLIFSKRNTLELIRDPITVFFGCLFPVLLLLLLRLIGANVPSPEPMFPLEDLTPGIAVFGQSFLALFSGMLLAKDRSGAFLERLFTTPLTAGEYLGGYILPFLPIALLQCIATFAAAACLGLPLTWRILPICGILLLSAVFFLAIGLLCGTYFSDKQVGSICGALFTNITAFLSGAWFPVELLGKPLAAIAHSLPFVNAADAVRAVQNGTGQQVAKAVFPVVIWSLCMFIAAAASFFLRVMRKKR